MSEFEKSFFGKSSIIQPVKNFFEGWTTTKSLIALAAVAGTALVVGSIVCGMSDVSAWKSAVNSSSLDHILTHAQGAQDWGNKLIQTGTELADPYKFNVAWGEANGLLTAAPGELSDALQGSYNQGVQCVNDLVKPGSTSEAITAAIKQCAANPYKL